MSPFEDIRADIDEKATERMHFRAKPHIKRAIQQAAALSGVDDSVFTMSAAYSSALATIAAHERTTLTPDDHAAFFVALDRPAQPTAQLKKAFERRAARAASK